MSLLKRNSNTVPTDDFTHDDQGLGSAGDTDHSSIVWMHNRLVILLVTTIAIAAVLTVVSMVIYTKSGAAQLDLSRPGYRSVSSQADKGDTIDSFSASGTVNKDTVTQFIQLYDDQAKKTTSVDAFNGDPLNPEVLGFGDDTAASN